MAKNLDIRVRQIQFKAKRETEGHAFLPPSLFPPRHKGNSYGPSLEGPVTVAKEDHRINAQSRESAVAGRKGGGLPRLGFRVGSDIPQDGRWRLD